MFLEVHSNNLGSEISPVSAEKKVCSSSEVMHTPTNHRHKSKQRLVSFIIPVCWWCNFLIWLYSCAKLMCQAVTSQRNCTFIVCAYHRLFTPSWAPPWPPCSLTRNEQLSCQSCRKGKLLAVRNLGGPQQRPLCGIIYPSSLGIQVQTNVGLRATGVFHTNRAHWMIIFQKLHRYL